MANQNHPHRQTDRCAETDHHRRGPSSKKWLANKKGDGGKTISLYWCIIEAAGASHQGSLINHGFSEDAFRRLLVVNDVSPSLQVVLDL